MKRYCIPNNRDFADELANIVDDLGLSFEYNTLDDGSFEFVIDDRDEKVFEGILNGLKTKYQITFA